MTTLVSSTRLFPLIPKSFLRDECIFVQFPLAQMLQGVEPFCGTFLACFITARSRFFGVFFLMMVTMISKIGNGQS